MKRVFALLLTAVLLLSAAPAALGEEAPAPTPEPTEAPNRNLSWKQAFRSNSFPKGSLTPEEIAFYAPDEQGNPTVVNVPKTEVMTWWEGQESLPRTRYFEQFLPENLAELYPVLDYAVAHGFCRASIPTTSFSGQDVAYAAKYLRLTYSISNSGISALSVASFDLEDGQTLQYVLVTLPGMDYRGHMSEYLQAVAAAREIVAGMPEGMGEYEKALYLYQWLTENVRYDRNDYYEGAWTLLYDTLVKRETVCAGYAEALYVLYNLAGIECFTVSGYLNDPLNGGAGHIWNVAKIDGEYYQFDSTWDEGVPPEGYHFFGVSADRLQLYYPRHVETLAEEYCPACTKSLPLPDGRPAIPASGELSSGALEEGRYRQAFWDLQLYVDESWTPYSREQIAEALYTEPRLAALDVGETLAMGLPYVDLMLERGSGTVQVLLERGPITTSNGESCDSPEDYMDNLALTLPEMMKNYGLTQTNCRRYETEICGRSYACLAMTARSGWVGMTETYLCTQRDGIFLTLVVASSGDSEKLVRELVNGLEGEGA